MNFDTFLSRHPMDCASTDEIVIPVQTKIDEDLRAFLHLVKVNSFSNGFFRTINPDGLVDLFPRWKWAGSNTVIFMRTAFGGLIYKNKANYFFFDPLADDKVNLTNDLNFVLNVALCDERTLESAFLFGLYQQGVKLKGVPQNDECFAFVPALKMGGVKSAKNLEIVKLKEHLLFLSQI